MAESKDPVCGMRVDPRTPAASWSHEGINYLFCGVGCRERFAAEPRRYLALETGRGEVANNGWYTCPMHPEIRRKGPGSCPKCGMALEPSSALMEDQGFGVELRSMIRRFWASVMLTLPVILLAMSEMIKGSPVHGLGRPHALALIQLALSTPVVLWGGWPFFQQGLASLRNRSLNMFTLVSIGTGTAYFYSVVAAFFPELFPPSFHGLHGGVPVYFEAAASITTLVLLGQVLELRARERTGGAIRALLALAPKTARLVEEGGGERDVPVELVKPGDRLRLRPGERVPVDGVVIEGEGAVDESMITGESMPSGKRPGSRVSGGTVNGLGAFVMRADRVGGDTLLAHIVRMVGEAQRSRAPIQRLADAVSAYFVPAVVLTAVLTFAVWGLVGPQPRMTFALVNAVAVLIIACPCALGLATPVSIMVGTGRGALSGILVKDAAALETLEKVDVLVVDKTGTLTEGRPRLASVMPLAPHAESELLRLAASVERGSEHPLAAAISSGAKEKGLRLSEPAQFKSVAGKGVSGVIEGKRIAVGSARFLSDLGVPMEATEKLAESLRREGQTVFFVAVDGRFRGMFGVADPIKETAAKAIADLHREGLRVIMVTGDNKVTADAVARRLGIDEVKAGVLPDQKGAEVKRLQIQGRIVAMAGDGVNDAPALAQAHVGIAMGTGTDVAIESAGVTLVKGDLRGIVKARKLSRAVMRNIRQNLFFSFAYNLLGVPVASGILYPAFGLLLSPMFAAAAMTFSSVSVIGNALRLRKVAL